MAAGEMYMMGWPLAGMACGGLAGQLAGWPLAGMASGGLADHWQDGQWRDHNR